VLEEGVNEFAQALQSAAQNLKEVQTVVKSGYGLGRVLGSGAEFPLPTTRVIPTGGVFSLGGRG
jgi:hypothetical protein